jgi:F-type H+-transporting ATPase subunit a
VISLFIETISPLSQFEIIDLILIEVILFNNLNISLPNIGACLLLSLIITIIISILSINFNKIVSDKWSISPESLYDTIRSIVLNQINPQKGQIYFPFLYTLFIFILINNLIGMIPYSFSSTSHFILTFALSFTIVWGATILGFLKHGFKFFSLLVPAGCPLALLPLLVTIEFISYLARNISLGLRLAANILSGHMLLNILSGFTYKIMISGLGLFIFYLIPLLFITGFSALEVGIAFIQGQVFLVLSSSYIKDGLDLH